MIPDPDTIVTRDMVYKVEFFSGFSIGAKRLTEEFNSMAQKGWMVDKIVATEDDVIMVVYLGWVTGPLDDGVDDLE